MVASKRETLSEQLIDVPQETQGSFAGECAIKKSETESEGQKQRYEVELSVDAEVFGKLEEAMALLSGRYPKGVKLEDVFEEALESLLERRSPKQRGTRRKI